MPRPKKRRHIEFDPKITYFKPRGVPLKLLKQVELSHDEIESIRLKYIKKTGQIKASKKMQISQSTFQRILNSANTKIAQALVEGKAIKIIK